MEGLKLQVATFDNVTGDKARDVNTHYNTLLGGVIYIVIYYD